MVWPSANDYFEALQHPLRRFCKPELKRAQAALDEGGKPRVWPGKKADVYEMRGAGGVERWAIGCFTREPQGMVRRYQLINEHLQEHPAPALVETELIEQGICIRGRWYPITRSRWAPGQPLNAYVREYLDYPHELLLLADVWVRLANELRQAGIAHGNLCCETVLVSPGANSKALALHLVDYDGVFVPALAETPAEEMGHGDFQHPTREWQKVYAAHVDRFPQLVVFTALHALSRGGRELWDRHDNGENLLFRHSDFQEPATSPLLRELWQSDSTTVRALAGQLILASQASVAAVPPLELIADKIRGGGARAFLTAEQIEQVENLLHGGSVPRDFGLEVEDRPTEDFGLEIEDEIPIVMPVTEPTAEGIQKSPPPLPPKYVPPELPACAYEHPDTQTYQIEAWLPNEVAVMKLQGFAKDVGGEIVESVPGYIRVNMLDQISLADRAPKFLSWLGLVPQPAAGARVTAVMELNLVHKITATRQLVGITIRLTPPGASDNSETPPGWKSYCDRVFCELRAYLIGYL
jgi:hypothetical protein